MENILIFWSEINLFEGFIGCSRAKQKVVVRHSCEKERGLEKGGLVGDFQACFAHFKVVGNEEVLMVDMLPLNPLGRWWVATDGDDYFLLCSELIVDTQGRMHGDMDLLTPVPFCILRPGDSEFNVPFLYNICQHPYLSGVFERTDCLACFLQMIRLSSHELHCVDLAFTQWLSWC